MAILLDQKSRIVIQGITGSEGSFHTRESVKLGTKVVAGVTPGKGGTDLDGIPVYNRIIDAVEKQGANVSGIYTPAAFAPDAIWTLLDHVEMQEELEGLLNRKVDLVSRRGIERSRNFMRRDAILNSAKVFYAAA